MEKNKENNKKNKKKKEKIIYAKMCPRCKSINVHIGHQGTGSGLVAIGVPTLYRCMDCGFRNTWFPEVKIKIDKILKIIKNNLKND